MAFPSPTRLRTFSQVVFLLLFLLLIFRTDFRATSSGSPNNLQLTSPVAMFFQLDPLVAISNALASRALYHGLLWSLLILIPTFFLGRFLLWLDLPPGHAQPFFR